MYVQKGRLLTRGTLFTWLYLTWLILFCSVLRENCGEIRENEHEREVKWKNTYRTTLMYHPPEMKDYTASASAARNQTRNIEKWNSISLRAARCRVRRSETQQLSPNNFCSACPVTFMIRRLHIVQLTFSTGQNIPITRYLPSHIDADGE